MEFRLFLPLGTLLLPEAWREEYSTHLQRTQEILQNMVGEPSESREDSYLLGKPYFGLKYRSGSKLEIKIRAQDFPGLAHLHEQQKRGQHQQWIEQWHKQKLGKKDLAHYKRDIIDILSAAGYGDVSNHATLLDAPEYLSVQKSRKNAAVEEGVVVEYCLISTTGAGDPHNWLSIAVEGDLVKIKEFIKKTNRELDLWRPVRLLHTIMSQTDDDDDDDEASVVQHMLRYRLIPVVAGYPQWVLHAGGKMNTVADCEASSVSLAAFIAFLNE